MVIWITDTSDKDWLKQKYATKRVAEEVGELASKSHQPDRSDVVVTRIAELVEELSALENPTAHTIQNKRPATDRRSRKTRPLGVSDYAWPVEHIELSTKIEALEWKARTIILIKSNDIRTVEDLVKKRPREDLLMKDFNARHIKEIADNLAKYGLRLGMTDEEIAEYSLRSAA